MVRRSQCTSISPVGILGLRPAPRSTTVPVTPMQNSERSSPAWVCVSRLTLGSNTIWVKPPRSRRSTNTQPPWSRREETHPNRTTFWPTSAARRAPQSWVRFSSFRNSGGVDIGGQEFIHPANVRRDALTRALPRQLLRRLQLRRPVHPVLPRKHRQGGPPGRGLRPPGTQGRGASHPRTLVRRRRQRLCRFSLLPGSPPALVVRPPRLRLPAAGRRGPLPRRHQRPQVLRPHRPQLRPLPGPHAGREVRLRHRPGGRADRVGRDHRRRPVPHRPDAGRAEGAGAAPDDLDREQPVRRAGRALHRGSGVEAPGGDRRQPLHRRTAGPDPGATPEEHRGRASESPAWTATSSSPTSSTRRSAA